MGQERRVLNVESILLGFAYGGLQARLRGIGHAERESYADMQIAAESARSIGRMLKCGEATGGGNWRRKRVWGRHYSHYLPKRVFGIQLSGGGEAMACNEQHPINIKSDHISSEAEHLQQCP